MIEQDEYLMQLLAMKDMMVKQKVACLEVELRIAKLELNAEKQMNELKREMDELIIYKPHEN
jgi:hypothetical protein